MRLPMQEARVPSLSEEDSQKEMTARSSIPAWRIPWTEEPGGLQYRGCKESDTTEHTRDYAGRSQHCSPCSDTVIPGAFITCFVQKHGHEKCVLSTEAFWDETQTHSPCSFPLWLSPVFQREDVLLFACWSEGDMGQSLSQLVKRT